MIPRIPMKHLPTSLASLAVIAGGLLTAAPAAAQAAAQDSHDRLQVRFSAGLAAADDLVGHNRRALASAGVSVERDGPLYLRAAVDGFRFRDERTEILIQEGGVIDGRWYLIERGDGFLPRAAVRVDAGHRARTATTSVGAAASLGAVIAGGSGTDRVNPYVGGSLEAGHFGLVFDVRHGWARAATRDFLHFEDGGESAVERTVGWASMTEVRFGWRF